VTSVMSLRWPTPSGLPPFHLIGGLLILLILLALSAPMVEVDPLRLITSLDRIFEFSGKLFAAPDWTYLPQLLTKLLETVEMTLLGTAIACAISLPLGFLAARNTSPHPVIYRLTRDLLSLMRSLPELVWALIFVSAVGLGPLPGVMALAFVTVGFMGKFFADSVEVVGIKAVEGLRAHGANWLQVRLYAILPQALPDFSGITIFMLDHNLRQATILGLVGAGGIGYDLVVAMRMFEYERMLLILLSIYLIVTLLDRISDLVRSKIIQGHR